MHRLVVAGLGLDLRNRRLLVDGRSIRLSSTEAALLRLLMLHVDDVVSHEDIFARVWGYDFNGNANIIHTYISYLRRKVPSGDSRLRTVRGLGYMLLSEPTARPRRRPLTAPARPVGGSGASDGRDLARSGVRARTVAPDDTVSEKASAGEPSNRCGGSKATASAPEAPAG